MMTVVMLGGLPSLLVTDPPGIPQPAGSPR